MSNSPNFEAPWPGVKAMPRWTTGELIDAPVVTWKNLLAMIGPGLVMGASAIGGGEWLAGPAVTAKYGPSLLWIGTVSILFQVLYNIEISRYTLYSGEPIFTGKFRLPPHPYFWVLVYLAFDWGSVFPYLATNAAIPLETVFLGEFPTPDTNVRHWWIHKCTATALYLLVLLPLIFGGKIYDALKWVMGLKLVVVIGFLLILGIFFARWQSWAEIGGGLFQFGTVPVIEGEDRNANGVLDPGEDFDRDGRLDVVEQALPKTVDSNGDGKPDSWKAGPDGKPLSFVDLDGDRKRDGNNSENVFVELFQRGRLPDVDWSLIALISGLAAIAGNGGLTNTPISNFTRDQGWGMGHHVGAIPSVVGGHGITLSHEGCVFEVNEKSLPRWRRWYRHIVRDQVLVWMGACLIGLSLPSILSVEFVTRGTDATDWDTAVLTSEGVRKFTQSPRPDTLISWLTGSWTNYRQVGAVFWALTLLCGFLVMITSHTTTTDGYIRRWVDVFWTASPQLRKLDASSVRYVYFSVLCVLAVAGVSIIWLTGAPGFVFKLSTTGYNFAFAFSAWHTLVVNTTLLPPELRPNWLIRVGLVAAGCFFLFLGVMAALKLAGALG
jgi:hypothetical protein